MLLITNIGRLQTPEGTAPLSGEGQGKNRVYENACVLLDNGIIQEIYENGRTPRIAARTVDAHGRLVTPGLVDCHTHLVFGGYRQHEIPLKLKGASYLEILKSGGGILDTVRQTRASEEVALYEKAHSTLTKMLEAGTCTVEAKSGYGLDIKNEVKQLHVAKELNKNHAMDVVSTFMGAHAVPPEYTGRTDEYVSLVCDSIMPYVAERSLAEFCDVFCEDSVFDAGQSERVLRRAKELGFKIKIHADEIEEIGGAELAGKMEAISAEHLIATGEKGIAALARGGVIAALLPGTSFYLNKSFAGARDMIHAGVPVAIASDYNPGSCPSFSLQLCINLGYLKYRMRPEEVLTAVTLNAACAIGRGATTGTIEPGKQGDLVIWDAPDFEMLCYRFGLNQVKNVIKKGEIAV